MAFILLYNDKFPLRAINFIKKYLDTGGTVRIRNRVVSQLSKLQVIDYFFPSLFIKELPESIYEASYNYETCFIMAPRKQGVLSNWGSYKQKINNLEDCILGNSKNENTYKNHLAAQSMLRRAVSDLLSQEGLFSSIIFNLQMIYENQLDESQKQEMRRWLKKQIAKCKEAETVRICTADRTDGFSFNTNIYDSLISRVSSLYDSNDYRDCWIWFLLGSLFGNYSDLLMKKYQSDFSASASESTHSEAYSLISSPSVIAKPFFCGRGAYLQEIDRMYSEGKRVIFLYGIDGIGKTEIAKQYAIQYKNKYDVIIYALYDGSLKDMVIAEAPFEIRPALQRQLISGKTETDDSYFRRKLNIIKKYADQRTLLIIDNFNTERDDALSDLIQGRYRMLFTTQYDYSRSYPSIKIREIDDMDSLISIFMHQYQGYAVDKDDPDLANMIRAVNGHTFTVELLARHMENSGQSAAEMLEAMHRQGLVSLSEKIALHEGEYDEAYLNLIRMFSIFEFSEEEQRILQLLSLMPLSGVPAMEFIKWAEIPSTKILTELEKRGWITRNEGGIAFHPVVKRVIQHVLPVQTDRIRPFLDHAAKTMENEQSWHYTKQEKEQYASIARSVIAAVDMIDENTILFYQSAAVLLGYSGYSGTAIEIDKKLYQYRLEHDGSRAFETARAAYRIGWTYMFDPHLKNALKNAEDWLLKSREIFDSCPKETVQVRAMYCGLLENIAKCNIEKYVLTRDKQYLERAAEYAKEAVDLGREWLSDYTVSKKSPAGSLLKLADIHMLKGEYEAASGLVEEAYRILTSIYSDQDPDVLRASSRRAIILYHLGRYSESLAETEKNIAIYKNFYGDENPSCYEQLVLKIKNCIQLGMRESAVQAKKEAMTAARKIFPPGSSKLRHLNELL
ncbi:MAG: hypothetical protein K6G61_12140 [Solobacterium sp.]|nr:hypothetical protein [Solobacterium sp.]